MSWLLASMLVDWLLTFWAYRSCNDSADGWGGAFFVIVGLVVGIILTVIYLALVLWNHRFH